MARHRTQRRPRRGTAGSRPFSGAGTGSGWRRRNADPRHWRRRLGAAFGLITLLLALVMAGLFSSSATPASGSGDVRLINISGIIDPLMGDYVIGAISDAEGSQARAVVLQLDTPGGLDTPMRDIIKKMESSPLPIIVYVAPSGARAASAGTFLTVASDLAAMAPGTNIGAAHPVAVGADPSTVEGEKIVNDAAAYIRSLAEINGHDADWAELAVRQSVSLSADGALAQHVIDMEAPTLNDLLNQANGFVTKAKNITLDTQGATVTEAGMSARDRFLHFLANPTVAYLLLIIGLIAVAEEFVHPGVGIGALLGIICLAMSLYGLYVLPINYVGVGLIVLGMIFLGLELYFPSHGALTAAGIIAFLTGSFFLYDSSAAFLRVSIWLEVVLAALASAFFLVIARAAFQARRMPRTSPRAAMIGATGVTRTGLDPLGQVFVHGEIWSAEAPEGESISQGEEVEVTEVAGLLLKVRKL